MTRLQQQVLMRMLSQAAGFISGVAVVGFGAYGLYKIYKGLVWFIQKLSMKFLGFAMEPDLIFFCGLFGLMILGFVGWAIHYWYTQNREEVARALEREQQQAQWRELQERQIQPKTVEMKTLVAEVKPERPKPQPAKKAGASRWSWMMKK